MVSFKKNPYKSPKICTSGNTAPLMNTLIFPSPGVSIVTHSLKYAPLKQFFAYISHKNEFMVFAYVTCHKRADVMDETRIRLLLL